MIEVHTHIPTNKEILSIRNIKDHSNFWFELQLIDLSFEKCNREDILYFDGKNYYNLINESYVKTDRGFR